MSGTSCLSLFTHRVERTGTNLVLKGILERDSHQTDGLNERYFDKMYSKRKNDKLQF